MFGLDAASSGAIMGGVVQQPCVIKLPAGGPLLCLPSLCQWQTASLVVPLLRFKVMFGACVLLCWKRHRACCSISRCNRSNDQTIPDCPQQSLWRACLTSGRAQQEQSQGSEAGYPVADLLARLSHRPLRPADRVPAAESCLSCSLCRRCLLRCK